MIIEPTLQKSFSSLQNLHSPKKIKRVLVRKPEFKFNKKFPLQNKNQGGLHEQLSSTIGQNIDDTIQASNLYSGKIINSNSVTNLQNYNTGQSEKELDQQKQKSKKWTKIMSFISPRDSILSDSHDSNLSKELKNLNTSLNRQKSYEIIQNPQVNISQLKKINSELRSEIITLKSQINFFKSQLSEKQLIKITQPQQNQESQRKKLLQITKLYQQLREQMNSSNQNSLKLQEKLIDMNNTVSEFQIKLSQTNKQLLFLKGQLQMQRKFKITDQTYIYQLHQRIQYLNLKLQMTERKSYLQQIDRQGMYRLQLRNESLSKINQQLKKKMHRLVSSGKSLYRQELFQLSPDK